MSEEPSLALDAANEAINACEVSYNSAYQEIDELRRQLAERDRRIEMLERQLEAVHADTRRDIVG